MRNRFVQDLSVFSCLLLLSACAVFRTPSAFTPESINEVRFRDREETSFDQDVRVTVAVPTAEEVERLFQTDLLGREIQPVWVKIENHSEHNYYLLSTAVDPSYFSPMEAIYAFSRSFSEEYRTLIESHFRAMGFKNPILPNTAVSGFVFTNLDEGEKVVQVDLVAAEEVKFFTFYVQIPGMRVDYRAVDFATLYPETDQVELSEEELRNALELLPCCTTDQTGEELGDPLNLIVIGHFKDIGAAFTSREWLPAEETYSTAVWKTVKSFLFGSRYRYSPVSPLYFSSRQQDFARQKPRHDIHERNHLRLWYTPMRYQGRPVFVGQISRDIGVRFTTATWPPVTHKIDPDIDEARNALIEDLLFSQRLARVGFVKGVGLARPSNPRTNLTGDPYFTDGHRVVLILEEGPIAMDQIKALNWENPKTFHLSSSD